MPGVLNGAYCKGPEFFHGRQAGGHMEVTALPRVAVAGIVPPTILSETWAVAGTLGALQVRGDTMPKPVINK